MNNPVNLKYSILTLTVTGLLAVSPASADRLESPDGSVWVEVEERTPVGDADYPSVERLYFRAGKDLETVVDWSPLGIEFTDQASASIDLLDNLDIISSTTATGLEESFSLPHGKQMQATSPFNEMVLTIENAASQEMQLEFRAFNDGIAFRYVFAGTDTWTLVREHSGFRMPAGSTGYLQMKDFPVGTYAPNYQDPILKEPTGTLSPGNGYVLPGLFVLSGDQTWMLFHETGVKKQYYGAHIDEPTVNRLYQIALPHPDESNGIGPVVPTSQLPFNTPWRIFSIGNLTTVSETNLVHLLADPFDVDRFGSQDWVKPGKSAWSWWSQGTGTPSLQYEYIDFAEEFGWEYILIDARWDQWLNAAQEVQDLVAYADARNVRINLWYNSGGAHNSVSSETPRDRMLDPAIRQAEMDMLQQWGIAGIKVDFFFSDKQDRIQQYIGIMEDAMERDLLVNFHGCTVPRGWTRTYPNLMSMEAVAGAENYKWRAEPEALQNVRYTYTRNVVGPMDYTPLTFESALWNVNITYAHQLALGIVYESGIQHFADQADSSTSAGYRLLFSNEPEVAPFLTDLPVAWHESRLLDGHPDTHAVWARRRGSTWYVGGINGLNSGLATTVYLDDLTDRPVRVESFARGSADNDLTYSDMTYEATDSILITMTARDGFSMKITPVPLTFTDWITRLTSVPAEQDPQSDIDKDGLNALMEFVFDRNPLVSDAHLPYTPVIIEEDGSHYLRFKLRDSIILNDLTIEKSSTLPFSAPQQLDLSATISDENNWHWLPFDPAGTTFFRITADPDA